jgi:hypothetical protein
MSLDEPTASSPVKKEGDAPGTDAKGSFLVGLSAIDTVISSSQLNIPH